MTYLGNERENPRLFIGFALLLYPVGCGGYQYVLFEPLNLPRLFRTGLGSLRPNGALLNLCWSWVLLLLC